MATENDSTMDTAMAAFAALDAPEDDPKRQPEEGEHDGPNQNVDDPDEEEDVSAEAGDEQAETDEQEDEPAPPAIDPPASWDAEAKKVFASLPPEAQRIVADRESAREKVINARMSEAATARKQVEAVTQEAINMHQRFADQLSQYAAAFEPQRPDYALLGTDPQAYAQQLAYYEAAAAQRNEIVQRADQTRQTAEAIQQHQLRQAAQEFHSSMAEAWGDEWTDQGKRQAIIGKLEPLALELGYGERMSDADAVDHIALRKIADWKDKAVKWDQLQASKMQNVRDAKLKPKVQTPGTAPQKGAAKVQGFNDSMSRLRKSGDVRDAAAAFANIR